MNQTKEMSNLFFIMEPSESQRALKINELRSYFVQAVPERVMLGNFKQALRYRRLQEFSSQEHCSFDSTDQVWQQNSNYILHFKHTLTTTNLLFCVASIFSLVQVIFSYFNSNLGFFDGYRMIFGQLSLAGAPQTENGYKESVVITIPDLIYSLIMFFILIVVKNSFRKAQFACQIGKKTKKTTPAVVLQNFFANDQAKLRKMTNFKRIQYIKNYRNDIYQLNKIIANIHQLIQKCVTEIDESKIQELKQKIQQQQLQILSINFKIPEYQRQAIVVFTINSDRQSFINMMKQNWRTSRWQDRLFGSCLENKQLFCDTAFRLKEQYVDQPEDRFPQVKDQPTVRKVTCSLLYVLIILVIPFASMALMSLPIVLGNGSEIDCYQPNVTQANLFLNSNATKQQRFCFCQLYERLFFDRATSPTFYSYCQSDFPKIVMPAVVYLYSALALLAVNLLVYLITPFIVSLLPASTRYGIQYLTLITSVFLQTCNNIVAPVVINVRWNNVRGINTINIMLSGASPNNLGFTGFSRIWYTNLSVWIVGYMLAEIVMPWLILVSKMVWARIMLKYLQLHQHMYSQASLNQAMMFDQLNIATLMAKFMSLSIMILFYSPGMPILNLVGSIALFSHVITFFMTVFGHSTRGYLPPIKFYVNVLRTLKYCVIVHLVIGSYMYSCVLNPPAIFATDNKDSHHGCRILNMRHILFVAAAMLLVGVLEESVLKCFAGDQKEQEGANIKAVKSYAFEGVQRYTDMARLIKDKNPDQSHYSRRTIRIMSQPILNLQRNQQKALKKLRNRVPNTNHIMES